MSDPEDDQNGNGPRHMEGAPTLDRHPSGNGEGVVDEREYGLEAVARMEAARDFPRNTCPSSRHAQMCAEFLVRDGKYSLIEDEPAHVGGSIASTVAALYEARSFLGSLGYTWTIVEEGKGRWVKEERAPSPNES